MPHRQQSLVIVSDHPLSAQRVAEAACPFLTHHLSVSHPETDDIVRMPFLNFGTAESEIRVRGHGGTITDNDAIGSWNFDLETEAGVGVQLEVERGTAAIVVLSSPDLSARLDRDHLKKDRSRHLLV